MIKFFRKIRQELLNEGKTSKYLKYAVGEIILVVIGILIALQINNWNENRKSRQLELLNIEQLILDIQEDSIDIQNKINRLPKHLNSYTIIENMNKDSTYKKIFNKNLEFIERPFLQMNVKSNAVENISQIINGLTNNTMKRKLRNYAQFYERLESQTKYVNEVIVEFGSPLLIKYPNISVSRNKIVKIANLFELSNDEAALGTIKLIKDHHANTLYMMKDFLEQNKELLDYLRKSILNNTN
ncbi:hypothetical protein KO566_08145 [Flavobacteriaceae bacterium XHP0103]|uniref:DUF6090 family protein n=1 Tax=Marixanthotalea marina TaxID=2844359 RepID=UPI002989E1D3|nr:DUF6090 family protein [Marixanthotalea marina]MBU3822026.1 hypothetical protein [Marixanthotalea marina]